ncbi:hypothetical protein Scep_006320 [Stephania cephalantha]|uniref:CCHC-type domain-containing protein n=1 Tax=Stephania cephalantha TaxID=152367 RepID=A0AAP0PJZ2_9MAGN
MSIEDLILRLRVEEDHRKGDKKEMADANANMVVGQSSKSKSQKLLKKNFKKDFKRTTKPLAPKGKAYKKIKGSCWVCQKQGHRAQDCRHKKDQDSDNSGLTNQANVTDMEIDDIDIDLTAVVPETNMVSDAKGWWIDTGATRHICSDKDLFYEFHPADSEEKLYMGNSSSSMIEGKGTVKMKFTSGKVVTLLNVLYVPDIRKNLVSGPLLNKKWFKLIFESDKFVLTKGCMFIGKGYLTEGLFKLNIVIVNDTGNKMIVSAYMIESFDIWHARLGHVNNKLIHKMVHLNMLPKFKIDLKHKCEVCAESKFVRQTFKSVHLRSSELLDLIHSDLCHFKSNPTR